MFNVVLHPAESDACFMMEAVEAIVSSKSGLIEPLETSVVQGEQEEKCEEVEEYVKWIDSFEPNKRNYYEPLGENT